MPGFGFFTFSPSAVSASITFSKAASVIAVSTLFAILGVVSDWSRWYSSSSICVQLQKIDKIYLHRQQLINNLIVYQCAELLLCLFTICFLISSSFPHRLFISSPHKWAIATSACPHTQNKTSSDLHRININNLTTLTFERLPTSL